MKKRQFKKLLRRYKKGKATGEEKALVEGWYNYHATLEDRSLPEEMLMETDLHAVWQQVVADNTVPVKRISFRKLSTAVSIAAVFLLFGSVTFYFTKFYQERILSGSMVSQPLFMKLGSKQQDIGAYDAYVQLGSGATINLDSVKSGKAFSYDKVNLRKEEDGTIVYKPDVNKWDETSASRNIHTIHVPKAKQSKLILSDGTKVWLNSESSISFPEVFAWNERHVEVSGEVYFEVTRDVSRPFYVKTKDAVVKVLGTSCNVSAYLDENISSTTLVTGSVNVFVPTAEDDVASETSRTLIPGEQWAINKSNRHVSVKSVDIKDIIAWKDGLIAFTNLDLKSIMKKVARWYDVEVEYESYNQNKKFTGGISSRTTLDEFIQIMELYQVKIENQGNGKLVVRDK